jgi:hypothetical protein
MPNDTPSFEAQQAQQRAEHLAQQQVAAETREVLTDAWSSIAPRVAWDSPEDASDAYLSFATGGESAKNVAIYEREVEHGLADYKPGGSPYEFHVTSDTASRRYVVAEQQPKGYQRVGSLQELREAALEKRRAANTARARHRSGRPNDIAAGLSERGWDYGVDPRTGQQRAELRMKPLSPDEDHSTRLDEIRGMAADPPTPKAVTDESIKRIDAWKKGGGPIQELSLTALAFSVVEGPEGGYFPVWRIIEWDPAVGYPKGPGVRVVTLRKLYERAGTRRDVVRFSGRQALLAIENPLTGERG